jgi:glycosyltransferase involved in cell wall biosynthesis
MRTRLYYTFKPFIPYRIRLGVRRWFALRRRERVGDIWPIVPGSEVTPVGWPGWPEGKQFAFVLSHDVEGIEGAKKVRQLAELEMSLGFRSCFNFIPEGGYTVPADLRDWLTTNGFEVGVHDLRHDGKLYRSRARFKNHAVRINHYLKDWGATGFRSGFMLNQLEWLHDLHIQYDSSTFDIDPFEPQPHGLHTIFPFWVPNPDSGPSTPDLGTRASKEGYVELPYTLPQDSTLFLLFRETTPRIWFRKLDWVSQHRGMALVNVHPDYIRFDGEAPSAHTYPVDLYTQLLKYVRDRHAGVFWPALPRMVASCFTSSARPTADRAAKGNGNAVMLKGKRAAVLLYSYYPSDPRPRREAEALVSEGMDVELICLRETAAEPACETINGVKVTRLPLHRRRRESKLTYTIQYGSFIVLCAAALARRTLHRRYDLVHVHNMPDVLVLAALVPKLLGARVILDLHDPMPELMMTIYNLRKESRVVGMLRLLEKWSIAFADRIVTVNLACKKIFGARSCSPEKIEVIMNSPDESVFKFRPCAMTTDGPARDPSKPFNLMCHGSIVERHGHDIAVAAVEQVRRIIPSIQLRIYGRRTAFLDQVMESVREKKLDDAVQYLGACSQEAIVAAIKACDLGIIPNRRAIFTELNTPTRIFEYLACGVPVVSPRAPGILDYFNEQEMIYFELGDADDLARQIEFVHSHPREVQEFVRRGQQIYRSYQWRQERARLVRMTSGLLAARDGGRTAS